MAAGEKLAGPLAGWYGCWPDGTAASGVGWPMVGWRDGIGAGGIRPTICRIRAPSWWMEICKVHRNASFTLKFF